MREASATQAAAAGAVKPSTVWISSRRTSSGRGGPASPAPSRARRRAFSAGLVRALSCFYFIRGADEPFLDGGRWVRPDRSYIAVSCDAISPSSFFLDYLDGSWLVVGILHRNLAELLYVRTRYEVKREKE